MIALHLELKKLQKQYLVALNKMEDSEQEFRSQCDQGEMKGKRQLKVVLWALCKESNIANGEGQNMGDSLCGKSDQLKKENEPRDVQKFFASPYSVEGLERMSTICWEDQDLKTTAKAEWDDRDNIFGLETPKIENVDDGLKVKEEVEFGGERREQKEKVDFGEERKEGKCIKFEDSKDCSDESQAAGVEMTQVKETAKAIGSILAMENEDSQSQVKAEYEEGSFAKDIERKHNFRATEDVEKVQVNAEYEEGSRREQIGEVSEAKVSFFFLLHHNLGFVSYIICPFIECCQGATEAGTERKPPGNNSKEGFDTIVNKSFWTVC